MKRMTAKDYSTKREDLINQLVRIHDEIKDRLLVLSKLYPEAPIAQKISYDSDSPDDSIVDIKALSLNHSYINDCTIELCLIYIQAIEKYAAELHPHQQLNLF